MKNDKLKQMISFFLKSCVAGLALAFVISFYLPVAGGLRAPFQSGASPTLGKHGLFSYNQAVVASAPAVVNVYATKILQQKTHPLLRDPVFRRFFGDQDAGQQRNSNLGSGVILNADGYVVTNAHVITAADEILVTLSDGRQTMADVIGVDAETDLAVLKINLKKLPAITLGDSNHLHVGDVVLAIGNPYDFGQTVTQGIISATGRKRLGITTFENFIQTDADINPGNSGGALISATGQLIGINTAIVSTSGGSQGIGFAIPINQVVNVMRALIEHGHVVRGWLGIEAQIVPQDIADAANLKYNGVLVAGVLQRGPAAKAGIMPGDILTKINGEPLLDPQQAIQMISQFQPGRRIDIVVLRGWQEMILQAIVSQRPSLDR